jgi:hypothetical protein
MLGGHHIFEKTNSFDFCNLKKKVDLILKIIIFQNLMPWLVFR